MIPPRQYAVEPAMSYADKEIPCRDCGGRFLFTAGEQEFYASKGFMNEPTRCPARRRARKHGAALPEGPCPHDVSGLGSVPGGGTATDNGAGAASRHSAPRRERMPYTGPLPDGPVAARVLRIDPAGRFLFARVESAGFDVYVHHSLFRNAGVREGDRVTILVEDSERGPRARSLWTDQG